MACGATAGAVELTGGHRVDRILAGKEPDRARLASQQRFLRCVQFSGDSAPENAPAARPGGRSGRPFRGRPVDDSRRVRLGRLCTNRGDSVSIRRAAHGTAIGKKTRGPPTDDPSGSRQPTRSQRDTEDSVRPRRLRVRYERAGRSFYSAAAVGMTRIAITPAAYHAICSTLPADAPLWRHGGQCLIQRRGGHSRSTRRRSQ